MKNWIPGQARNDKLGKRFLTRYTRFFLFILPVLTPPFVSVQSLRLPSLRIGFPSKRSVAQVTCRSK